MSDENELAVVQQADVVPTSTLSIIQALASNPACDPEKLERLLGMQERFDENAARKAYGIALAKFQSKCPIIPKHKSADRYKYAGYDDIMAKIRPILGECGISVSFSCGMVEGGKLPIAITLQHGIHAESKAFEFPVPAQMRVNDTQKMGAALSYARRYALCGALNIVVSEEDIDAAGLDNPEPDWGLLSAWGKLSAKFGETAARATYTRLCPRGPFNIGSLRKVYASLDKGAVPPQTPTDDAPDPQAIYDRLVTQYGLRRVEATCVSLFGRKREEFPEFTVDMALQLETQLPEAA